ncbi:MAG: helix-turn-helix domain-containing protein [Thermoguttaceae bacterium]|nr:helix-turn-helix domain-containing protein [Thermoguttaceae bacterium]
MYYNLAKTAEILGLQTGDVNRLREQGKIRAFKDGADWKFRKEEVEAYLTKMIKERSGEAKESLLSSGDDDEDRTTFAADSAAFDAMFDQAGKDIEISTKADDLVSAVTPSDDLTLAPEDDDVGFSLTPEEPAAPVADSGLVLTKEGDTPLTSEDSALAEDPESVDLTGGSGSGSGDGMNLSNSDSGLSLLDDIGGSNVDLAGDDLVLGGSSGSGSGDGMNLSNSDSGLSLLGDSDAGFELDAAVSEQGDLALADESKDDGVYSLVKEPEASPQILDLDDAADSEAPTELAADESVFELSTSMGDVPESSESRSSAVFTVQDPASESSNPFVTDDGSSEDDGGVFGLASDAEPIPPAASDSSASNNPFLSDEPSETPFGAPGETSTPFLSDEPSDSMPFGTQESASPFMDSSDNSPFGEPSSGMAVDPSMSGFDGFGGASAEPSFGDSTPDFNGVPSFDDTESMPISSNVSSTQYTGKDLIFLVPCLICLILATVGALELCRTIWSYQEGSFDLGGPLLEAIAKMANLMK